MDDAIFVFINICNPNIETEQILKFPDLSRLLENADNIVNKNVLMGADFNFYFDSNFKSKGGKPILKKKYLAKITELIENFYPFDIRRIRNSLANRFTFRQNHYTSLIQQRLDYFFISNAQQKQQRKLTFFQLFR